jgi:phosphatidylglycerophosphate synthase
MLIYLSLTYKELIPEHLTQVVIIRDVLIVIGTIHLINLKKKIKIFSLKISKVNTIIQMFYILWTLLHISYSYIFLWKIDLFFIIITILTTIISGISYGTLWIKYIKH